MEYRTLDNWREDSAQLLEDVRAGDVKMEARDECGHTDDALPSVVVRLEINLCALAELIHPDSRMAFKNLIKAHAGNCVHVEAPWNSVKEEKQYVGKLG